MARSLPSALACCLLAACGAAPSTDGTGGPFPAHFPEPEIPEDNPLTSEKAELGRYLFYDVRLSVDERQSCGSCHRQARAFSDGEVTARTSGGERLLRNTPTLANVAYNATFTWSNPALRSLERHLRDALFGEGRTELDVRGHEAEILERIAGDASHAERFARAFPERGERIGWDEVVQALACFVRTLASGASAFDAYAYRDAPLEAAARRGMELFFSEALECHHCHGGFNFAESRDHAGELADAFHNTGLYSLDGAGSYPPEDPGVYALTGDPLDMGKFRAPTLRNVALTAPYMHDGSIETLLDVIRFYEAGGRVVTSGPNAGDGRRNPLKSPLIRGFSLSPDQRQDLLRFLESLTDQAFVDDPALGDPFEAR